MQWYGAIIIKQSLFLFLAFKCSFASKEQSISKAVITILSDGKIIDGLGLPLLAT